MKKLMLVAALGVAGVMSANSIENINESVKDSEESIEIAKDSV